MNASLKLPIFAFAFALTTMVEGANAHEEDADLSRLVIVGDSLAAGHQNSCLLDTQQVNSFANLLAEQAGTVMDLPLISSSGFPPCLLLIDPTVPVVVRDSNLPGGRPDAVPTTNLSVPGARVQDALDPAPDNSFHGLFGFPFSILHSLVLAGHPTGMSQVDLAESLDPTTVVLWLGSNDVLWAMIGADARFITPEKEFKRAYRRVISRLARTGATLVTADIPDITVIPFLTPAVEFAEKFGLSPWELGLEEGDFVTTLSASPLVASGYIGPLPNGGCIELPADELFCADVVLEREDAKAIRRATRTFNRFIARQAKKHGAALMRANALLKHIDQVGYDVDVEESGNEDDRAETQTITTAYADGVFSFDGIHPSNTGHAVLANAFIAVLNRKFGADIDPIEDEEIAEIFANDPFNPANF